MGPSLRILHAVRSDGFAGVERYVSSLAAGQASAGHRVTVIGGDPTRMQAAWPGMEIRFEPAVTVSDVITQLRRAERPDVLHAHMTAAEIAAVVTRPILRAPIIATRHFARQRGSSVPTRLLGRIIGQTVRAQISISRYVADRIDGPSTVIHLGTPTPTQTVSALDRDRSVLVAQRFEAEKRTDLALRAWAESGLGERGWVLRLAGDGALRQELEQLSADLGVAGSCEFLGYQTDLDSLLRSSAVFLAPCPNEGFGLSVVEAMARATPVVAAREGAHPETVGAAPGALLYPAEDAIAGGRLLSELADDVGRRAEYGAILRRTQEQEFSIPTMVAATLSFYQEALG